MLINILLDPFFYVFRNQKWRTSQTSPFVVYHLAVALAISNFNETSYPRLIFEGELFKILLTVKKSRCFVFKIRFKLDFSPLVRIAALEDAQ